MIQEMTKVRLSILATAALVLVISCGKDNPSDSAGEEEDGQTGTVTDVDGNTYQTVKIGDQWWMAENLKVTHYRNGEEIPMVSDSNAWYVLETGAYCSYANNIGNIDIYGGLYNWYAVGDDRNIAPEGWHIPSNTEWQVLIDYLGGDSAAAAKLMITGNEYWVHYEGATNSSGFSALPAGFRTCGLECYYYYYEGLGYSTVFWSSDVFEPWQARARVLNHTATVNVLIEKPYGLSIR